MTTQTIALTTAAADVSTAASMTSGSTYTLQNVGGSAILVAELAAAPAAGTRHGHILGAREFLAVKAPATGAIYAWGYDGPASLAVSEAA